ncbi:MAG: aminotransferase class V-fold PLP-dependent enzyme [Planctomycetota bacterium]
MTKLWIPGPTEVRPEILAELARPMIGHRSPAMTELIESLDPGLGQAFGLWDDTTARVGVGTHSATAMMEASLHGAGQRILCIAGGAFARRWHQIAERLGKDTRLFEVEPGKLLDDVHLADVLDREGPFDAVTLVVNETSTGVCTPIQHVSNVLQAFPDTLLLCDVVSYLAGGPVEFDEYCLGLAFAGVNKALALPPGITVFCVSEDYVERAESEPRPSWYLDPLRTLEGHEARRTPTTPAIPHYRALARQLADIETEGWDARFERHARMRARTLEWAAGHGLAPFPEEAAQSPTVSCIDAAGLDVAAFVQGLKDKGFEISNGYGDLKGKTFRIGHMGDHSEADLETLLSAADEVLAGLKGS